MARRSEEYARLKDGGGYTQALTIGKGFSGTECRAAKQGGSSRRTGSSGGGGGGGTVNAYARHQELIRNYLRYHPNAKIPSSGAIEAKPLPGQKRLTDEEALRRQHRFVRDQDEDNRAHQAKGLEGAEADPSAWEVRMASKYYRLLFKEYALADLSRYREDKIGLRWRTERDVVSGKGQFECGALRCQERKDLHSYELNFRYKEAGVVKNELVKVRVCPQCARKLFRKKIKALRRQQKQQQRQQREAERLLKKQRHQEDDEKGDGDRTGGSGMRRNSDGTSVSSRAGDSARAEEDIEYGRDLDLALDGHGLVRRAVAAAASAAGGGNGGTTTTTTTITTTPSANKRNRPSRWGEEIDPCQEGAAAAALAAAAAAKSDGGSGSYGARTGSGGAVGDEDARQAWAGELERERTEEDEMDDYLSSLLL
eukprot:g15063.t1